MKKKTNEREIPLKNYVYAFLILVGVILLVLYIFSWYNVKKEEKLMNSYLISSKTIESKIDDINSLEQTLTEAPLTYFVLVSYTGNEEVYNLERNLKRLIDKYKLNDSFYYVDSTKIKEEDSFINNLNKIFNTNKINVIPSLIYVEEGKIKEVLNNLKIDDFKKLLDTNDFKAIK